MHCSLDSCSGALINDHALLTGFLFRSLDHALLTGFLRKKHGSGYQRWLKESLKLLRPNEFGFS